MPIESFKAGPALVSLKAFQRRTVDYVFDRFYDAENPAYQFLVADEVGLGKTLVARGVIAKAIEHLWDKTDRIDILYICSNQAIAAQCTGTGSTGAADPHDAGAAANARRALFERQQGQLHQPHARHDV
jgi:hypothetical protein